MKPLIKPIILFVLIIALLASCNTSPSKPTATLVPTLTKLPISTSTTEPTVVTPSLEPRTPVHRTPKPAVFFTFPVDRHDPESVIRAFFDAMERSDLSAMVSVLHHRYGQNLIFEPVDSINISEIKLTSQADLPEHIYSVLYKVQWKDPKKGIHQIRWSFYLTWDGNRDSWIITNYGY